MKAGRSYHEHGRHKTTRGIQHALHHAISSDSLPALSMAVKDATPVPYDCNAISVAKIVPNGSVKMTFRFTLTGTPCLISHQTLDDGFTPYIVVLASCTSATSAHTQTTLGLE